MSTATRTRQQQRTKIVCTLGPATESKERIIALIRAGMNVARLNMSHGTLDQHRMAVERVREAAAELSAAVGVMVDVPGPKYRTGPMSPGAVELVNGDEITLTSDDIVGSPDRIGVAPPGIHRDTFVGRNVLLDDGVIELRVLSIEGTEVRCEVIVGGRVTERRGVTTPGTAPSQPFPDDNALEGLRFAAECEADFVALSAVTSEDDVHVARSILSDHGLQPDLISKIERSEAIIRFSEILEASDAIMVARGDLGAEVRLSRVPVIQKELISRSNAAGKPVITATQMLESMIRAPRPTRAEATDVANAIFDGTDAIMLSGETSIGQYPIDAVAFMSEVAREAESALEYGAILEQRGAYRESKTDDAIGYNACQTAYQLNASLIVAFTESGSTVGRVSRYRPSAPILGLTQHEKTRRRMTLRWGVTPVTIRQPESVDDFFASCEENAGRVAGVGPGSLVVLVAGLPIGVTGGTNMLRVLTMEPESYT